MSDSDARPAGQMSSEPSSVTARRQEATDSSTVTTVPAAPQSAFASNLVASWTSSPLVDSQRDNLRQASVALDTAYERINSLRNSINTMLNRIPPEAPGSSEARQTTSSTVDTSNIQPRQSQSLNHDANIRPPHSALVLSGEQVVEELNLRASRLRSLISPSTRQRLDDFESNNRSNARREFVWDRFSQGDRPHRLRTPPMPDLVLPRTRDLQSANRDDSSTMIGRRVAARVSASDSQGSLSSRMSLSQIEQRLQAQTSQIARELESMTERLAASRSRRVELASSRVHDESTTLAPQENRTPQAAGSTIAHGDMRVVPNPPMGGRPLRPNREVALVNTTRIVLPQQISRTSSDGTPIDEPSAPVRRGVSAAFREHIATYRDQAQVTSASQDSARNLANAPEVRGTLVNLLTREREDARPSTETNWRDDVSLRSNITPLGGQSRRRRGWTRLNADGDEIDEDEDDNVPPHTRRLRMRFSYGAPSVDQPAMRSQTVTIEDILWRTSGSDSEVDALSPDATESCQSSFQGSPPRPAFRRLNPLPTPVEDMLVYPTARPPQRPRLICVSKYASLAGR